MYNLTVQNEALTLAGYLSKVDIENACNLSKPDMRSRIAGSEILTIPKVYRAAEKVIFLTFDDGVESFSDITTRTEEDFIGVTTRGGLSFATSTRDEFSDSIKKYPPA